MHSMIEAVAGGASAEELASLPVPDAYLAAHTRAEDAADYEGRPTEEKDIRKTVHLDEVPMPELAPDEALVAVMASAINYNTVWSALFEPLSTFRFLPQMRKEGPWGARHDQPYHVLGSDASGVIVRTGSAVRRWAVGDRVVVATAYLDGQDPASQQDGMLAADQKAWGFETNFGGLAHFTVVKVNQLMPKPAHLTWEEAACNPLCAGTAYRMLVSPNGAGMKQGDVVLIWGATGGLGGYAVQYVRNGGGIPVGVVGSGAKADLLRDLGCEAVVNRSELTAAAEGAPEQEQWREMGRLIRRQVGEDPHIVFEHVGRQTFGASVVLARRGGTVVTCGSSTGYMHQFDNRYLWMKLKRIVGSHGANYQEAYEANRLIQMGRVVPTLSAVYPLEEVAEAAYSVQRNDHIGKVGVRVLAPGDDCGVEDPALRERVGEERIRLFRDR